MKKRGKYNVSIWIVAISPFKQIKNEERLSSRFIYFSFLFVMVSPLSSVTHKENKSCISIFIHLYIAVYACANRSVHFFMLYSRFLFFSLLLVRVSFTGSIVILFYIFVGI